MKKLKHSKIKNTGIIFELLSTQITSDMINNRKSPAIDILSEYFKKGTNLNKELSLYQTLLKEKFSSEDKANRLIDEVIKLNGGINKANIRKEKYNLIKEIKKHYVLEDFVKNKINNYKVYASVYKILENRDFNFSPSEIVTSRFTLVEFITSKPQNGVTVRSRIVEEFSKHDSDVRKMAHKIIIDKFNQKYQNLGTREKSLLREYINTISDSPKMKEYINAELKKSKLAIAKSMKSVTDSTVKIKLNEVINIVNTIIDKKKFDESTLLTVLHVYKLETELLNTIKK